MDSFFTYIQDMFGNPNVRRKLLWTVAFLALYRFLVYIPVPFVDIDAMRSATVGG
jgi:preprotein translocase subunit SecY